MGRKANPNLFLKSSNADVKFVLHTFEPENFCKHYSCGFESLLVSSPREITLKILGLGHLALGPLNIVRPNM